MRVRLLLFPSLLMAACTSAPDSGVVQGDPQISEGRFLANVHCSECHAITRSDASKHPDAPPLREISRNYPVIALEESLAEGIVVGHPDMPEYRFRPEDVAALISYLESIQTQ